MNDFIAYSNAFNRNCLKHYGVKGMHWGVRRYQDSSGRLTAAGREHYGVKERKHQNESEEPKDGISEVAALAIVALTEISFMTVPIAAAAAVQKAKDNARDKRLYKEETNPNKLTPKNLKTVNPNWGKPEYSNNCVKCSATTELIARGMTDITVGPSNGGFTRGTHEKWFVGAKGKPLNLVNETTMTKEFSKMPNGASGSFGFSYPNGMGGHSIHWTKLKDGTIRFEDGQSGQSYSLKEFLKEYKPATDHSLHPALITRLDNCKPNMKALEQAEVFKKVEKKR